VTDKLNPKVKENRRPLLGAHKQYMGILYASAATEGKIIF